MPLTSSCLSSPSSGLFQCPVPTAPVLQRPLPTVFPVSPPATVVCPCSRDSNLPTLVLAFACQPALPPLPPNPSIPHSHPPQTFNHQPPLPRPPPTPEPPRPPPPPLLLTQFLSSPLRWCPIVDCPCQPPVGLVISPTPVRDATDAQLVPTTVFLHQRAPPSCQLRSFPSLPSPASPSRPSASVAAAVAGTVPSPPTHLRVDPSTTPNRSRRVEFYCSIANRKPPS